MEFEGNIQDMGADSGPVQAFESFVPAALDGIDMGSFEPTESFEPAQPNPFKVTSAPSEELRTAQNQSESVAGVSTASGATGSGGKSSEDKKADAREYHARLAQIILSNLPTDISNAPHKDDEITIKVGGKEITVTQGDLYQLARKNASNPALPPDQQLFWAQMAAKTNPYNPADPAEVQAHWNKGTEAGLIEKDLQEDVKNVSVKSDAPKADDQHAEAATTEELTAEYVQAGDDNKFAASFAAFGPPSTESALSTDAPKTGERSTGSVAGPLDSEGTISLAESFAAKAAPDQAAMLDAPGPIAINLDAKAFTPVG